MPRERTLVRAAILCTMALALAGAAGAGVSLPALFGDHMVVQRDRPVHVWGDADPGEPVTVSFRGETRTATTDRLGRWSIHLGAGTAGGPFEIVVQGGATLVLRDVLVGDVWVASGQSNMELPLRLAGDAEREIAGADAPELRFFRVLPRIASYPREDLRSDDVRPWTVCQPGVAAEFSAVAYHFAREVQTHTGVPIGIIQSFWGGTPAESWTSLESLSTDPALMPVFAYRAKVAKERGDVLRQVAQAQATYDHAVRRGEATGLVDPSHEWRPDFEAWAPGALHHGMIAPITPFPIRGVIWYQGESNAEPLQHPVYEHLFSTLIADWRRAWGQGDFPFLYVQLANYGAAPANWNWPAVREAQRRTLAVARTAMVVTIDIGESREIHPRNKRVVGERLALAARALAYGDRVEHAGPLFRQATPENGALRVWFDHAAGGLQWRGPTEGAFEVAGADGSFAPAAAMIDGDSVLVSSPAVAEPRWVRYAWAADPVCPLVNGVGLTASPFTSRP